MLNNYEIKETKKIETMWIKDKRISSNFCLWDHMWCKYSKFLKLDCINIRNYLLVAYDKFLSKLFMSVKRCITIIITQYYISLPGHPSSPLLVQAEMKDSFPIETCKIYCRTLFINNLQFLHSLCRISSLSFPSKLRHIHIWW